MRLILYSKPGCHLCEGLQEKLEQINSLPFDLEVRDITTREDWFLAYQYEIPVLFLATAPKKEETANSSSFPNSSNEAQALVAVPRFSPRASVAQVEETLRRLSPKIH